MNSTPFWSRVQIKDWDSCWLWTGFVSVYGYGRLTDNQLSYTAHGYAYRMAYGSIPQDKDLHHICRNKRCVNPRHLVAVSAMNHPDSAPVVQRQKTHCPRNHEYSDSNTYLYTSIRNFKLTTQRICRTCADIRNKNRKIKN